MAAASVQSRHDFEHDFVLSTTSSTIWFPVLPLTSPLVFGVHSNSLTTQKENVVSRDDVICFSSSHQCHCGSQ